jgi:hypothetical protein
MIEIDISSPKRVIRLKFKKDFQKELAIPAKMNKIQLNNCLVRNMKSMKKRVINPRIKQRSNGITKEITGLELRIILDK